MKALSAVAQAHPNIAFIKYWGNQNPDQRIPVSGSISMNLDGLSTITKVTFCEKLRQDELILNGKQLIGEPVQRISFLLNKVRALSSVKLWAKVETENNFPTGAGIASSAAAFAALAAASSRAADLELEERDLTRLARLGSGSACRSVPGGFVEWYPGDSDINSFAETIAAPDHWDLVDCIAVVQETHKQTGSSSGHKIADSSPLQPCRISGASQRISTCRKAIKEKDFEALAIITEADSNLMHAVMMTSNPPLFYWAPATLEIMNKTRCWRAKNIPVCYTIDAGPNVHIITTKPHATEVQNLALAIPGVIRVISASTGGPVKLLSE